MLIEFTVSRNMCITKTITL